MSSSTSSRPRLAGASRRAAVIAALSATALALGACGSASTDSSATTAASASASGEAHEHKHGSDRFVFAYDGGVKVVDGSTLEEVADFPMSGFLRLNPFGDNEHVLVTTESGFQVLSTGAGGGEAKLTDLVFPANKGGHVVPHGEWTSLFADGSGEITLVKADALGHDADETVTALPDTEKIASEEAHHGVAVKLSDGTVIRTLGNSESRKGALAQDASGTEITRNEECPGVHGEGVMKDEAAMLGCENGVLLYKGGAFTKIASPDADYGRVGNSYVTGSSPIAVTDYKDDRDAEGVNLHRVGLLDSAAGSFKVVDMPSGVEYTWRGIRRDGDDNAWVLGTDGALHKLDVASGSFTDSIPVIAAWEPPAKWQDAHPALQISGSTAWVTEPSTNSVYKVDLTNGEKTSKTYSVTPNEVAFAKHTHADGSEHHDEGDEHDHEHTAEATH